MAGDPLADGAEQQSGEPAAAPGADDQKCCLGAESDEQLSRRQITQGRGHVQLRELLDEGRDRILEKLAPEGGLLGVRARAIPRPGDVAGVCDLQYDSAASGLLGRPGERCGAGLGTVDSDEDR